MIHRMRLHPEPFEAIKAGTQLIETRLYDEKRQQIKVGDQIVFLKRPEDTEKLTVRVVGVSIFRSFHDLFRAIDKHKFGYPEGNTLENQVDCMRKYYPKEEEDRYGVVGIHLEVISQQDSLFIRIGKEHEVELLKLANKYLSAYYGDQTNKVKEWINHQSGKYGWIYSKEGVIAGWLVLQTLPQQNSLKISSLCVVEEFRNQGLGSQLMNFSIEEIRNRGKHKVWCTVNEKNTQAKNFLLQNSFQVVESKKDMYLPGEIELILCRKID